MIVVFPFHGASAAELTRLLLWIEELGVCKGHKALLVADAGTSWVPVVTNLNIARRVFDQVTAISNLKPVDGWPAGPNSLFYVAAKHINDVLKEPWFWCETDAIPLKRKWMDTMTAIYEFKKARYMGVIVPRGTNPETLPEKHFTGVGVYPADAWVDVGRFAGTDKPFDIASAGVVVPMAASTTLIHHFWGRKGLPPTFVSARDPAAPENVFTMANVPEEAVVYHRNKDGTLIDLLRRKLNMHGPRSEFVVVLPFCNKDAILMLRNLQHQRRMRTQQPYDAVVAFDLSTNQCVPEIVRLAKSIYANVQVFNYPVPTVKKWPEAANWAFQHVARKMEAVGRSWLWAEPDFVPLKPDWIEVLQARYKQCGQPLMGSVVKGLGHMNGTGVYPSNFPSMSPKAMTAKGGAFDTNMRDDTIAHTHDCSDLICHVWCTENGLPKPTGAGPTPTFKSKADVSRIITPGSVAFHRVKDFTLFDMLAKP